MTYFISDIHGEYALLMCLLDRIKFSDCDKLFVLGDMIDKGDESIRVVKTLYSMSNVVCILGNHEYDFLKYYRSKMMEAVNGFDGVLCALQAYFPTDGSLLDWNLLDWLDVLPAYVSNGGIIGVHAGVPLDSDGHILPLERARTEMLVYDRTFKNPNTIIKDERTVLYGHTPTCYLNGTGKIICYPRENGFSRIHLDTGVYLTGMLGCFCAETAECFYVKKRK